MAPGILLFRPEVLQPPETSHRHLRLQNVQGEEHQRSSTSRYKLRAASGGEVLQTGLRVKGSRPSAERKAERRSGLGQPRQDAGGARASPGGGGRGAGLGGHPAAGQPPSPSSTGSRVRPLLQVRGETGERRGCSPPEHVGSRCARSQSQPIRNIIYNNNNNNINNIRTSGSGFFSIYHLAGGRASGWHDDRYFCFQFSPSSAAAASWGRALPGMLPQLGRSRRCHSCRRRWQKHLKSSGFGFPLSAVSQEIAKGVFTTSTAPSRPALWGIYPTTTVCGFRQKTSASCFEIKTQVALLHISRYWKYIWLNTYLNHFGAVLNSKASKCVQ